MDKSVILWANETMATNVVNDESWYKKIGELQKVKFFKFLMDFTFLLLANYLI